MTKEGVYIMKEKFIELLGVRKLITLAVIAIFIVMALNGELEIKFVEHIIISVISYYFAKSTALDVPKRKDVG